MRDGLKAKPKKYDVEATVQGGFGQWHIGVRTDEKHGTLVIEADSIGNEIELTMMKGEWAEFPAILKLALQFVEDSERLVDEADVG